MHAPTLLPLLWREHHHHRLREMRNMDALCRSIRCQVRGPKPPDLATQLNRAAPAAVKSPARGRTGAGAAAGLRATARGT